jgi:hypothetical protein
VRQPSAPRPVPAFDVATARPAEEVWPDAVVRLPRYLPDGRQFAATARLDEDRFVAVPVRGNSYDLPAVYDAGSGRVTDLITERPPPDAHFFSPEISVSDRHIVLSVRRVGVDTRFPAEVWVAPRSGGPAVRRAQFGDPTMVVAFDVGETIYAVVTTSTSADVVTTIYRLPVDGSPEQVARFEDVPEPPYGRWLKAPPRENLGPFTFVDVVTGESRTATQLDGLEQVVCSPETCVGRAGADLVAYRFDGSGPARVIGLPRPARRFDPVFVDGGRFIGVGGGDHAYLWDRERNVAGAMLVGPETGQLQRIRYTDDQQHLLDLSRIT